jgi:hypothetical protein
MLTLEAARRDLRALPILVRAGLTTLVAGGVVDLVGHLQAADGHAHVHALTSLELAGHVGVLVGMVLILLGVVVDGVRQTRASLDASRRTGKEAR